jgi:hypothetical protein
MSLLGGGMISISGFFRRQVLCCMFCCCVLFSSTSIDFNLLGVNVTFIVPPDNMSASKSIVLLSSSSIVGDGEVALPIMSLSKSLFGFFFFLPNKRNPVRALGEVGSEPAPPFAED